MISRKYVYPGILLFLVTIGLIVNFGCGGGGNGGVIPSISHPTTNSMSNITPTVQPVLVQKPASGYLLLTNSVTDTGDTVSNISVLDVPPFKADSSGNQPFIQQVADNLKENPQIWNSPQIQELYNTLNTTLSQSQPLPSQAKVFSSYQDQQNSSPIPVNADGSFSSQVLANATDSTVDLEISLNDDQYLDTETVTTGSISSSCNDSSPGLKACPAKIEIMPGEEKIFKIYVSPSTTNLKDSGLSFTLKDSSIGCVTPPIYLCKGGKKDYSQAEGCFYAKKGLSSPVSSSIIAKTTNGLQVEIPVEIVKSTFSISGKVYTNGATLVKGHVKACGPKGCCKLDSSGNYTLHKVFSAHNVKVTATWWTIEGGKQVRHKEERIIDFLNFNVAGFNFGIPPTPTPIARPPYDSFYDHQTAGALYQFEEWEKTLGKKAAVQKTVDWLNKHVPDGPRIPDAISSAEVGGNPYDIWIYFKDGMSACIATNDLQEATGWEDVSDANSSNIASKTDNMPLKSLSNLTASEMDTTNVTVKNAKICVLSPYFWMDGIDSTDTGSVTNIYRDFLPVLTNDGIGYKVKQVVTHANEKTTWDTSNNADIYLDSDHPVGYYSAQDWFKIDNNNIAALKKYLSTYSGPINYNITIEQLNGIESLILQNPNSLYTYDDLLYELYLLNLTKPALELVMQMTIITPSSSSLPLVYCYLNKKSTWDNIVSPYDFETMGQYGVIILRTHGRSTEADPDKLVDLPDVRSYFGTVDAPKPNTHWGLCCSPFVWDTYSPIIQQDGPIGNWVDSKIDVRYTPHRPDGWWYINYRKVTLVKVDSAYNRTTKDFYIKELVLTDNYFATLNHYEGSLIFNEACFGIYFYDKFNSAKVYLGFDKSCSLPWADVLTSYFFQYMIKQVSPPIPTDYRWRPHPNGDAWRNDFPPNITQGQPLNVKEALDALNYYKLTPDKRPYTGEYLCAGECNLYIKQANPNENVYFPIPVNVHITQKK